MSALRLDRCLTLSVFRALRRTGLGPKRKCLPILMYHSVSNDQEESVHPYYRVTTTPQRFAEQMQWLGELGYTGVSLEEALPVLAGGEDGRRLVAITFDDGFRDFYTAAWPELQRHHFTATMYLPTGFIASPRKSFHGRECLTWDEVREMRTHGIRFGSHTVTHPKLFGLPRSEVETELVLSKEFLELELGEPVQSFGFPYSFPQEDWRFRAAFTTLLSGLGYQSCLTTMVGRARAGDDPFCLKRLPANSCDDGALFEAKLDGAYDWLGLVQRVFRQLKRCATLQRSATPA